ncbi:MAG: type VI secretion system Vgr family protein [Planctomycetota bacterium]|jgi:type VI secretion system secreted protein VgrG
MPRLIELTETSLFDADAVVTTFEGREELSQHFEYFLTIDSPKPAITPVDVIGKPIGFQLNRESGGPRYFHGYISHFWAGDYIASKGNQALPSRVYRIRVAPWSWFMTRAARSFVYLPEKQEKSVQEVLDRLMQHVKSYGHVNPWLDSSGASILKNRKSEHCVQYRESDYEFLARTLERYGVYYYFRHEGSKHTLVLSDKQVYPLLPEAEIDYPNSLGQEIVKGSILEWQHAYEFVSGKWSQTDYDFKQPSTSLNVEAAKNAVVSLSTNSGYEQFDYPNDYVRKSDGREEAQRRQEEEEVRFNTVTGKSSCVTMVPGYVFKLKSHYNSPSEAGKSYLLTSVEHRASQPGRWSSSDQMERYVNRFTCIPKEMQYRPARATPQPHLSSIQTAVVVGPADEEIYTDEFGRVKVQFHWDREGKRDENTSCWIRVSQSHAGRGFGGIDIPRIGEEVIVSFLEGDPDRPLITGRVYHQEAMPPFSLPGEKTRSGMKTKTYKGSGYNEMSMDDTPGKEQIRIHGQYNMDSVIENNETHHIKKNRTKTIDVDETNKIGNNQKLDVGVNKTVTVGTNHSETVGSNQTVNVGTNQSTTVGSNQSNTVGSMKTESVGMMSNEMVGMMKTTNVGAVYSIISGAAMNTAVGMISAEEVGMNKTVMVGSSLKITAGSMIEITCGASKLTMDSGGKVTISGTEFKFAASGPVKINGAIIDLN